MRIYYISIRFKAYDTNIAGVLLVWALVIIHTSKSERMDQGVVFQKLQDTIISENEWRIVLDFDMSEMKSEMMIMQNMCDKLLMFKNMSGKVWIDNFEFEYDRVYSSLKLYETDINDLFKLLPENNRTKRGLVNAGGYILKWLFGTPTTEDMDHVNSKVKELKELNGILLNSRQTQLTLMKDMNSKLILNTRAINEIMTKLSIAHSELAIPPNASELTDNIMSQILFVLKFTTMLRHLDQTIDEAKLRVIEFRQALELVSAGRVSSKLLPPHDFVNILGNISNVIPPHLKLVIPVNEEDLFMYYDLCTAQAVATPSGIRLFVTVPLSSADRQFETYKVDVIPLYQPQLKHWLKWQVEHDYIFISKDRQYYAPVSLDTLNLCRKSFFYLCPSSVSVLHHTVNGCLLSLFMSLESVVTKCPRMLTNNITNPFLLQNGNHWIYSVSEQYKIVLNCFEESEVESSPRQDNSEVVLNQSGIMKNIAKCDVFGKNGRIFSRIKGNLRYQRNITHLHIPRITEMILPWEKETLIKRNLTFDTLGEIRKSLADDHIGIELNNLLRYNKDKDNFSIEIGNSHTLLYLIICLLSMSLILFVVFLLCRRYNFCKRTERAEQQSHETTTIRVEGGSPLAQLIQDMSMSTNTNTSSKLNEQSGESV